MTKNNLSRKDFRKEAEKKVLEKSSPEFQMSPDDMKSLIHELQVHQIELEMQNEALQESRLEVEKNAKKYSELFNFSPVAYLTLTKEGKILELNKTATLLLQSNRERIINKEFYHYIDHEYKDIFYKFFRNIFSKKGEKEIELKIRVDKNTSIPIHLIATIDISKIEKTETCRIAIVNMTEQKKALEIIRTSIEDKERLNIILETQEQERKRIAETLHNGVGQILYTIKIKVDQLTKNIKSEPEAQEVKSLIKEAIDDLKSISYELVPTILEDFGLEAVINKLLRKLSNSEIEHTLNVYGYEKRLALNLEIAVFRIIQELINNIIKHSFATHAGVYLTITESIIIRVEDNGRGLKEGINEKLEGMGIRNIRNRVKLLNGEFSIQSEPGKGTLVLIKIPLPHPNTVTNYLF